MSRKAALVAIRSCGAAGDQAGFLRIYTENRISYAVAIAGYRAGAAFARWVSNKNCTPATEASHA